MKYFSKSDKNWINGYIANSEKKEFETWLISRLKEQKRLLLEKFNHYRKNLMRDQAVAVSGRLQAFDEVLSLINHF